jgi:uncharacterized membrane protein YjgN (DUF898 family)
MYPTTEASSEKPLAFSGAGGEYFRIWIVNLALTILTLGIYSAWAKVRRLQYFYRNTSLADNSFDYHGDPIAILKGRLIGIALVALYNATFMFSIALGVVVFLILLAIIPWLVQRSICFKLHNSSYRGLRFRFTGSIKDAYIAFLAWPLACYPSLGLLLPLAHQRIKAYQHNNSAYGTAPFSFDATTSDFYRLYLKIVGMILLLLLIPIIFSGVSFLTPGAMEALKSKDPAQSMKVATNIMTAVIIFYVALFVIIGPWFAARLQNLVWNHTRLGPHAFSSTVRARDLFFIYLTNFLGIILTLGLFKPFADIRLTRYRLTHMALHAQSNLEEFFASEQQAVSALGEETANVFDVDISF